MTTSQEILSLQARVAALEYLLKHALWNLFVLRADVDNEDGQMVLRHLKDFNTSVTEDLRRYAENMPDPALSDHFSAQVTDNAGRILDDLAKSMVEEGI